MTIEDTTNKLKEYAQTSAAYSVQLGKAIYDKVIVNGTEITASEDDAESVLDSVKNWFYTNVLGLEDAEDNTNNVLSAIFKQYSGLTIKGLKKILNGATVEPELIMSQINESNKNLTKQLNTAAVSDLDSESDEDIETYVRAIADTYNETIPADAMNSRNNIINKYAELVNKVINTERQRELTDLLAD